MRLSFLAILLACGFDASRTLAAPTTSPNHVEPGRDAMQEIAAIFPRTLRACTMIAIHQAPKCNEYSSSRSRGKHRSQRTHYYKRNLLVDTAAQPGLNEADAPVVNGELEKRQQRQGHVSKPQRNRTAHRKPTRNKHAKAPKNSKKQGKSTTQGKAKNHGTSGTGKKSPNNAACEKPKFPLPPKNSLSRGRPLPKPKTHKTRSLSIEDEATEVLEYAAVEKREQKSVTMGEVRTFKWTKDDWAYTNGLNGCSAIGLMNEEKIVWAHFQPWDTENEPLPQDHRDTHKRFLGDIEDRAIAAKILTSNGKARSATYAVMRIYKTTWNMQTPDGIDNVAKLLFNWQARMGLREDGLNFDIYDDSVDQVWVDRTQAPGGYPPIVHMSRQVA